METLFVNLTKALYGTTFIALSASFIWGILSVLLSPCHLSSIPLVIGVIDEQEKNGIKRAFIVSSLFSLGILITIALIGVLTSLAGRMMGDIGSFGNYLVGIIFLLVGLQLLGLTPPFIPARAKEKMKINSLAAAFTMGLLFGIVLGPCSFSFMAPILGIVFNMGRSDLLYGSSLILLYALGHCAVIVFAGTFTEYIQSYLTWNKKSKGTLILKKICGVLVIATGVYFIYSAA